MCFFPLPNNNIKGEAYRKGITEFECGACPECLSKRSSRLSLRALHEAKMHEHNCMITLTYDNYARDDKGRIIGELPPDRNLKVNVRDVQLFIKRLRKWWSTQSSDPLRYLATAEYGSRTHRAHYHCLIFGVNFSDAVLYKKSKRGSFIYKSATLTRLWGHGICTIDCLNVTPAVARYCTKYCAKDRSPDTFSLMSQHLGFDSLMSEFNGKSYIIDGREYPIPRVIWEHYIMSKYSSDYPDMSPKYVKRSPAELYQDVPFVNDRGEIDYRRVDVLYEQGSLARKVYRAVRDSDPVYSNYLAYWKHKSEQRLEIPVRERIAQLDDRKYHNYKQQAYHCLDQRSIYSPAIGTTIPYPAPRSNAVGAYFRYLEKVRQRYASHQRLLNSHSCRFSSCLKTATDTKIEKGGKMMKVTIHDLIELPATEPIPFTIYKKNFQLSLDFDDLTAI